MIRFASAGLDEADAARDVKANGAIDKEADSSAAKFEKRCRRSMTRKRLNFAAACI